MSDNIKYYPHKTVRYLPKGGTEVEYHPYNPNKALKYYMEEIGFSRQEAEERARQEVEVIRRDLE